VGFEFQRRHETGAKHFSGLVVAQMLLNDLGAFGLAIQEEPIRPLNVFGGDHFPCSIGRNFE
jgi:hypothetical protein